MRNTFSGFVFVFLDSFLFSKFLRFLFINVLANLQIFLHFESSPLKSVSCVDTGVSPIFRVFVFFSSDERRTVRDASSSVFPPDLKDRMRFRENEVFPRKSEKSCRASFGRKIRCSWSDRSITQKLFLIICHFCFSHHMFLNVFLMNHLDNYLFHLKMCHHLKLLKSLSFSHRIIEQKKKSKSG